MTSALVARAVGAVAGDVALAERVAAQQVVHSAHRSGEVLVLAGQLVRDREHHEVVENPAVGAPVPAVARGVGLAPRLGGLERDEAIGGGDDLGGRLLVAVQREVQRAGSGNPVKVKAVERERVRREHAARVGLVGRVAGREPQLGRRPRAVVGEVLVSVRAAAEGAPVVGRDSRGSVCAARKAIDGGVEQPTRVLRIVARAPALRAPRQRPDAGPRAVDGRCRTRAVGSRCGQHGNGAHSVPCTRWKARPASGKPEGTCMRSSQSSCQRHSSTSSASVRSHQLVRAPRRRSSSTVASNCHSRQRAAGHVLAVIAGVIPATGHVEAPRTRPARIQPLGILAGPRRHRGVAQVPRRTAIARRPHLVDRRSRSAGGRRTPARHAPAAGIAPRTPRTGGCAHRRPRP